MRGGFLGHLIIFISSLITVFATNRSVETSRQTDRAKKIELGCYVRVGLNCVACKSFQNWFAQSELLMFSDGFKPTSTEAILMMSLEVG